LLTLLPPTLPTTTGPTYHQRQAGTERSDVAACGFVTMSVVKQLKAAHNTGHRQIIFRFISYNKSHCRAGAGQMAAATAGKPNFKSNQGGLQQSFQSHNIIAASITRGDQKVLQLGYKN